MHLLTVGQSFKGQKDRTGTYKMESQHLLPRFEATNRIGSTTPARKPVATVSQPVQESLFSELVAGPALRGKEPIISTQKPAAPAPPLETRPAPAPVLDRPAISPFAKKRDNQWKTMIKELFFGRGHRRPNGSNVQGELALNNVTVVRNDLRETDLEVVPTRAQSFMASKPVVPPHKEARDWVRLTIGLIRPKKSEFYPSQGVASAAEQNRTPDLIARR